MYALQRSAASGTVRAGSAGSAAAAVVNEGENETEMQRKRKIAGNLAFIRSLEIAKFGDRPPSPPGKKTRVARAKKPPPSEPPRRSNRAAARLEAGVAPHEEAKAAEGEDDEEEEEEEKREPDVYSVEELNALGTCEVSYHASPGRLAHAEGFGYDFVEKVAGCVPCHWHRHNTRDPKVKCANGEDCVVAMPQWHGSYWCGPCLQSRFGENVLEILGAETAAAYVFPDVPHPASKEQIAAATAGWNPMARAARPDWICPACRGVCNCSGSGCVRARWGWRPTGALATKAGKMGYDSAAHKCVMGKGFDDLALALAERTAALRAGDPAAAHGTAAPHRATDSRAARARAVRKLVDRAASAGVRDVDGDARVEQRGPPIEGADPRTFRGGANARDVVCHLRALLDDAEAALASS